MSTGANPARAGPSLANGSAAASSLLQGLVKGGSGSDEMTLLCGQPGEMLKVGAAIGVHGGDSVGAPRT